MTGDPVRDLLDYVTDPAPDTWWYLSFADGRLPKGEQFLGGAYVRGVSMGAAVTRSHALRINPGGEVRLLGPIPGDVVRQQVPAADRERLLSLEELGVTVTFDEFLEDHPEVG